MSKVRMLVVGVGSIGERHVRCFLATGQVTMSICEPNDALREKVASGYDIAKAYRSLDEALAEPFDTILIATPAQLHIAMARQAVKAGIKHVLLEKPLAVTTEGVSDLQAEAKQAGTVIGVAYTNRANPMAMAMHDYIAKGNIGRVIQVSVVSGQNFPFFRPAYASTYYTRHATGGGLIQDALTHMVNLTQWFAGPITRLTCIASHQVLPDVEVEDTVNILAMHGDIPASYSQNQHQAVNETFIHIVGDKGLCRYEPHAYAWRWAHTPGEPWQEQSITNAQRDDVYINQARLWLEVMAGKRQPSCTLEEGLDTLKVNIAALKSAASQGQWVEIQ